MNNPMILASVKEDFYLNFIKDDRYLWLLDGLKTTLIITVFAVIVGLIIGFLVAIIRSAHDKSGSFKILNAICRVYLTVIRGYTIHHYFTGIFRHPSIFQVTDAQFLII